jgi:hypothetical protein
MQRARPGPASAHDWPRRHIEVASIPISGLKGEFLGAAALFWEIE